MSLTMTPGTGVRIVAPPGAKSTPAKSVSTNFVDQRPYNNWCWAACSVMIFDSLSVNDPLTGNLPRMCDLASFIHAKDCCSAEYIEACDVGAWPNRVFDKYAVFHNQDAPPDHFRTLTLEQIKAEIDAGRPIEILYQWSENRGAHVALVVGYYEDGNLDVFDPWFGWESNVTLEYVQKARYIGGAWAASYFNFHK